MFFQIVYYPIYAYSNGYSIINDPLVWLAMATVLGTGIAYSYWSDPVAASIDGKLRRTSEHAKNVQQVLDGLGKGAVAFEGKLAKQIAAIETRIGKLSSDVGAVKHETQVIDKHVGKLEAKTGVTVSKLATVLNKVDADASRLKRIDDQVRDGAGKVLSNSLQIDHLEHEVHDLELRRLDDGLKSNTGRVISNTRHIGHIEHEVKSLLRNELKGLRQELQAIGHGNGHGNGHSNGDYDMRRRAITELETADRKIEKLMAETIQYEAGYFGQSSWQVNGAASSQEHEEHHRKLLDTAQHIFRDVRKYLTRTAVQDMEVEGDQIDWSRGELFANPGSPEAVRAYHLQVKDYFIKLKEAISGSLHEITEHARRGDH
jgi:chromosome segregation ATPase